MDERAELLRLREDGERYQAASIPSIRSAVPEHLREDLALHRQTPTFIVGEPNSLTLQLRSEDLVLFLDIRNHVELMQVDPAGQCDQK